MMGMHTKAWLPLLVMCVGSLGHGYSERLQLDDFAGIRNDEAHGQWTHYACS